MKKFILLLLILPLTLMARPEKKWLQEPSAGFYGSIKWSGADLGDGDCQWTLSTTGSWNSYPQDTDCDDVAATKKGQFVSSVVTAGSSDIQYPRIKFSKVPKGMLQCFAVGCIEITTSSNVTHRLYDGTNTGVYNRNYYSDNAGYCSHIIAGNFYYDKEQTDVTIELQAYRTSAGSSYVMVRNAQIEEFEIYCNFYPYENRFIITK